MTVQEFAEKCNKRVPTVSKWLEAGFVPGVVMKDGEYVIPQSARKPYTECRAKGGKAILKSIVTACEKRCGVCAALYGISEAEFQNYISTLLSEEYISPFCEDEITYYNVTVKGAEWIRHSLKSGDIIAAVTAVVSAGTALI